jgi:hypothetical protein
MPRKNIYFTKEEAKELETKAKKEKKSMSQIIRERLK